MKCFKSFYLFITVLSSLVLGSCSHITEWDRTAEISEQRTQISARGQEINKGKNLIIEGKQSLKIALLKLKFLIPGVDLKSNSVLVMDKALFFANKEFFSISVDQKRKLQRELLPELYQVYSVLEEMKMTLVVVCSQGENCASTHLRNWIPAPISFVGISGQNLKKLNRYDPVLILSDSKDIVESIHSNRDLGDTNPWLSRWIKIPELSQTELTYNEWNELIPSVTHF